jgi:phosphoribosylformylglycinamidine cyclo-ligase
VAGLADARRVIQGADICEGDRLIGLTSSGLHTNGYSLARRALLDKAGYTLDRRFKELGKTLGEVLLEPHRNYAPAVLPLITGEHYGGIKGIAHITGGGLMENLIRILPAGLGADIRTSCWTVPPIFRLIQEAGKVPDFDPVGKGMFETFNMGIGLVLVAGKQQSTGLIRRLNRTGEQAVDIGCVVTREGYSSERVRWRP